MTLTFFGDHAGNTRVSVVPARLFSASTYRDDERDTALFAACAELPKLINRAWLWSGLSVHAQSSPDVITPIKQWTADLEHADSKPLSRSASLRVAERIRLEKAVCNTEQLVDFYHRTVTTHQAGFREESVRFGRIGLDSVFSHALHWQDVPAYIENLCEFVREMPRQSLAAIVAVFRQLVLVHPFLDGNGRFARAFAVSLSASAGWPRYVLLPALVAFRADSHSRNVYNSALASTSHEPFTHHILSIVRRVIEVAKVESVEARILQQQLLDLLATAAFGRRVAERMLDSPSIFTLEFARISGSSERNAVRWLSRLSEHGIFNEQGGRWFWTPAISLSQRLNSQIRAAIQNESSHLSNI
jgi:fido (protein-threonine AMPylation protein)